MEPDKVILSGFSDEAATHKTLDQQFSAFAALGMSYFSIRFLDAGNGIKNVVQLSDAEVRVVREKMREYGLRVSSIGSPIGKIKLFDFQDRSDNRHIDQAHYLRGDVNRVCELALAFETRLIRGFSFYPPQGSAPEPYIDQAVERLREIVLRCDSDGLTFGLEVEANLVGQNGVLLREICQRIDHPALVLVFDGANLRVQGYSEAQIFEQYLSMKDYLGWVHVKDYRAPPRPEPTPASPSTKTHAGYVDEASLCHFVPVGRGESAYGRVLQDLRQYLPTIQTRLARRNIEGVFLELEPHLKAGGQFGGFSGPDGFGVALRCLCQLLEANGIRYGLRDWEQMSAQRLTP